jgi:hypothetical protein
MTDGGRRGDAKYRSAARHRTGPGGDPKAPVKHRAADCSDLCQQLLFKGNVDQVVIRDHSLIANVNMTAERGNGLIAAGSPLRPPRGTENIRSQGANRK